MKSGGLIAMLLTIALATAPPIQPISAQLVPTRTRIGPGQNEQAVAVGRMVGGIASYATWPSPPNPLRICIVGPVRYAERLDQASGAFGMPVTISTSSPAAAASAACDILYVGSLPPTDMSRTITAAHDRPLLTIAEADPSCRSGAMFCLLVSGASLTFRLNIDAVSRSTVRVDPRVLRIAEANEERT